MINEGFLAQQFGDGDHLRCTTFPALNVPFIPLARRRVHSHVYEYVHFFTHNTLIDISFSALASDEYALNSTCLSRPRDAFRGLTNWGSITARSFIQPPRIEGQGLGREIITASGTLIVVIGTPKDKSTTSFNPKENHTARSLQYDFIWDYIVLEEGTSM